jgi:site-specific recombinase XerD
MHKTGIEPLNEMASRLLDEMEAKGYCVGYIRQMRRSCILLVQLANKLGKDFIDAELSQAFANDTSHFRTGAHSDSRRLRHMRCLHALQMCHDTETPARNMVGDQSFVDVLNSQHFVNALAAFKKSVVSESELKKNTTEGYIRIVRYFLHYCESTGYSKLADITDRSVHSFLSELCRERYQPTSIGAILPGLKLFLSIAGETKHLLRTFPTAPKRKKTIISVLDASEHEAFAAYLRSALMSARDKAICWLAFETGLRAVDMASLKIQDIDWVNDCIHIIQQKTSRALELPLRATYGNAIADYLTAERPRSQSPQLFLSVLAPFRPLTAHNAYRTILEKAFRAAGIVNANRICGTRFMRHNAASHMLKSGVPLWDISAALGHTNPNSADTYLATDESAMSSCCLPMPAVEGVEAP